ncbi:MAG: dTDP-4-dehydrorhamnose 3,5-epimerase [Dongiaceae bacterium]
MLIKPTSLAGLYTIEIERKEDERGFFARSWSGEELAKHGLNAQLNQCSISYNKKKNTLRGLHFQADPHGEVKIVRCTKGKIFDVAVDIRPSSPTYLKWHGVELSADNHISFYIPAGFAHGFQTLSDDSEVYYMIGTPYVPEAARGLNYADPKINIQWPLGKPAVINERDKGYSFL